MKILAYQINQSNNLVQWACSDGHKGTVTEWKQMITDLLERCDMAVVFSLDNFIKTIMSLFPKEVQEQLTNVGGRVYLEDGTKLYYNAGRMFSITYAGTEVNFFGLSRYQDTEPKDVQELLTLGEKVIAAYKVFGIEDVTRLTSPVSVYAQKLKTVHFPRSCDLPSSSFEMANKCSEIMTQEWRDTFKVGHWSKEEIFDYDVTSSYPSLMSKLPDITDAKFFESDTLPEDYTWGNLYGDLTVVKDVSPFSHEVNGSDCYSKGLLPNKLITTDQLWLLKKYGGSFDMKHGWFFKVEKEVYPFKPLMLDLSQKKEHPNKIVHEIAKGISVGVWGMLCQRYPAAENLNTKETVAWKLGDNFNSIYGAMVSSRCSVKVAAFIYENKMDENLVSVTVDGLLSEKDIKLPAKKEMGSWRKNEQSPALVVSQLYQWLGDKHPNGKYYSDMVKEIKQNPKSSVYGDIDLNLVEHKRIFQKLPRNGTELLNNKYGSKPVEVK